MSEPPESFPMPITKPVRWERECENVIVIYEPTESIHGGRVFLSMFEDPNTGSWAYDSREQMEETAEFIVQAVNARLAPPQTRKTDGKEDI